jgi:long-subunit acyl-CoA synthetase (AMP-forming)
MIEYSSPIDGLFAQVQAVQPTSMACPPNIWGGLYEKFLVAKERLASVGVYDDEYQLQRAAQLEVGQLFGERIKHLATGGAPTPSNHLEFARELCHEKEASLVNSYGATECGAITSDGRQLGSKFDEIEVVLLDIPELGFTHENKPFPRGEVVVSTPSLTIGYYDNAEKERAAYLQVTPDDPRYPQLAAAKPGRWYRTGDIAMIDNTGLITLIDRVSACVSTRDGLVRPVPHHASTIEGTVLSNVGVLQQILQTGKLESILEAQHLINHSIVTARPSSANVVIVIQSNDEKVMSDLSWPAFVARLTEKAAIDTPKPAVVVLTTVGHWTVANGLLSGAFVLHIDQSDSSDCRLSTR